MPSYQATVKVAAEPQQVFDRLDNQAKLAAHMTNGSAMMGGGRMTYEFDDLQGRSVGSHIRMKGRAFGLSLFVDEVVTVRDPPWTKAWATSGRPSLLLLSGYRMGFDLMPTEGGSNLTVWIDYDLAARPMLLPINRILARIYARWCVKRMIDDARIAFAEP